MSSAAGVAVAAALVLAVVPASASATAPPCPKGGDVVTASWGVAAGLGEQSAVATDVPRTGLAATRRAVVVTTDEAAGGRTFLCTNRRVRVRLPTLRSRQSIGAVSVNGPYVAWSVVAKGTPGVVNVARVQRSRLRDVRRTRRSTGSGTVHTVSTGAFVVLGDGTTAWSLPSTKRSEGAVWRRGTSPVPFSRGVPAGPLPFQPEPGFFGTSVIVLDDRNVLLDDTTLREYRPPTPGRCPDLVVGRWRDLAGWQVADVGGYGDEGSEQIDSTAYSVVCDPTTGRYLDIFTAGYHNGKGNYGRTSFGTVARSGRWLLRALIGEDDDLGNTEVTLTDTVTGERHVAGGNLVAPGIPHPAETPADAGPNVDRRKRWQVGAVVAPGATAWVQRAPDATTPFTDEVWLSDRAGTRVVAVIPVESVPTPTSTPPERRYVFGLTIDDHELAWTANGTRSAVPVDPIPGEPVGALAAVD